MGKTVVILKLYLCSTVFFHIYERKLCEFYSLYLGYMICLIS